MPLMEQHFLDYFDILLQLQQVLDILLPFQDIIKHIVQYLIISNGTIIQNWPHSFPPKANATGLFDFSWILEIFCTPDRVQVPNMLIGDSKFAS
jgi:hypothetical protein